MSPKGIYARTLRTCAARAGFLLSLGVLVFVPIGLLEALADRAGSIHISHLSELSNLHAPGLVAGFLAQALTSLFGEVFYAGAVALTIAAGQERRRPSLMRVARSLSYGRLIAIDLLYGAGTAVGLLLLVAPGVAVFTWFALAGPLVELENLGVKAAFARSRRLVRGRFWAVLAVLGPLTLASEALTNAALSAGHGLFESPLLDDWLVESTTNVVLSPFYAVAAVLITLELAAGAGARR
jgi:hypothetical protein